MSKKEQEKLETQLPEGAEYDGEESELDQEEAQAQAPETLDDSEGYEEEQELDWKTARAVLKKADNACGWSIDEFGRRKQINALKKRYNDKERSAELYKAIMALDE